MIPSWGCEARRSMGGGGMPATQRRSRSREGRPAGAPPRPTSAAAQAPPLFSMSRERGLAQPEDGGHERATARGEEVRVVAGQAGEDDQATARFTFRFFSSLPSNPKVFPLHSSICISGQR
jgi:hypothetical protein